MNWILRKLKKYIGEHKFLYLFILSCSYDIQPVRAISGKLFI